MNGSAGDHDLMPKQISGLNTYQLVQYLDVHYPDLDLERMVEEITDEMECRLENLQTGQVERVTLSHLRIPRYWFSHRFVKALHERIAAAIPDPRLGFRIGATLHKTEPLIRSAIGIPLLGIHRVAQRISREAAKFNRTKEYRVERLDKGLVVLRICHNADIDTCDFTMQWNAGCFASYARLAGATDVRVKLRCIDPGSTTGGAIWDFAVHYQEPPLPLRLAKGMLSSIPWIHELTERAEMIEADHAQQIIDRDAIINERTTHLLAIQRQLIDQERASIEQKLQMISRELVATEERERKAIAEDLHDSVTQLLAISLAKVKRVRGSSGNEELVDIQEHIEQALADLRSLTFQISPPVLYDFGLEAALAWLVEDVNERHSMQLIFSNLLEEPLAPSHQEKVTLYRAVRELIINMIKHSGTDSGQVILRAEGSTVVIEVADEGSGFDLASVNRGFGLYSLRDRLTMLGGDLELITAPGEGTIAMLSVPLDCSFAAEPDQVEPAARLQDTAVT